MLDLEKLTQSIFLHSSVEALNWTVTQLDCLFCSFTHTDYCEITAANWNRNPLFGGFVVYVHVTPHCTVAQNASLKRWNLEQKICELEEKVSFRTDSHILFFFIWTILAMCFDQFGLDSHYLVSVGFSAVAMARETVRCANGSYSSFTKLSDMSKFTREPPTLSRRA